MKYILLSAAVAFFVISLHQLFTNGLLGSYVFFMLTIALIILARMAAVRDTKAKQEPVQTPAKKLKPKSKN